MPAGFSTSTCAPASSALHASSASASCGVATIDDVGLELEQLVERGARAAAELAGERSRRAGVDVVAADEPVARRAPPPACRPISPQPTMPTRSEAAPSDAHVYSTPKQPWNSKSNRSSGRRAAAIAWRVSSGRRA